MSLDKSNFLFEFEIKREQMKRENKFTFHEIILSAIKMNRKKS